MSRVNLRCLLQRAALPTMGPKDLLIKVKWKFQILNSRKRAYEIRPLNNSKLKGRPAKEAFGIGLGLCLCV